MKIAGRAILFKRNDINTDLIIPGMYLTTLNPKELAKHAMEGLDPDFSVKASEGVIIGAGRNFGCGSSREQAPIALKYAGVKCIIAESFARIFFRNSINIGLPVLEYVNVFTKIESGDKLKISLAEGKIVNVTKKVSFSTTKLPEFIIEIINNGGLIKHLIKKGLK